MRAAGVIVGAWCLCACGMGAPARGGDRDRDEAAWPHVLTRAALSAARVEAGLNLGYRGGAGEVFLGWDRRIDPLPTDHLVADFFVFGVRLVVSR